MAKTYKHLWPELTSFENLLSAAKKAQQGKRFRDTTSVFNMNLEKEICRLQRELINKTYLPGRYTEFVIYEPVKRHISAAPYRDRVVHHALCNVIEPLFERKFIFDSYANRKEKGTHKAVDRFQNWMLGHRYLLKCDIRKYFPSIDHEILCGILKKTIADSDVMWLAELIIKSSNPQEPVFEYFTGDDLFVPHERKRGLPIGNLTSQFFANIYMNGFDHFVQEELHCCTYLRYVDDFAVFANDKAALWEIRARMDTYLASLRLRLHAKKTRILTSKEGCEFLGFYVYPHFRRVKKENIRLFEKRLVKLKTAYRCGQILPETITKSVQGWLAHAGHAQSRGLAEAVLEKHVFCSAN